MLAVMLLKRRETVNKTLPSYHTLQVLGSVVGASALYLGDPGVKSNQGLDFFGPSHTSKL